MAKLLQNRYSPDTRTFIGEGKAAELRELAERNEAGLVVFDNELSSSQIKALEEATGVVVIDRSALILDIFAQRAKTKEGRLQVELAQYKYLLPRLTGMGKSLSRLGGGIGTRGPGETKLETDRRHIRARISRLESDLENIRKIRGVQRERREKNQIPVVAIVGYTNAGKSTLLNTLTGAQVSSHDRLFETLDTTTRQLKVSDTLEVLISDTVGFINKLPHHLIEAFKATLEELTFADLLLHVIDASDEMRLEKIEVVNRLISELGASSTPALEVYNKADLLEPSELLGAEKKLFISAKQSLGIDGLMEAIAAEFEKAVREFELILPYDKAGLLEMLYKTAVILSTEYSDEGIRISLRCDSAVHSRISEYIVSEV